VQHTHTRAYKTGRNTSRATHALGRDSTKQAPTRCDDGGVINSPGKASKHTLAVCNVRLEQLIRVSKADGHGCVGQVAKGQHLLCEQCRHD
jgi:hypothetical protein